MVPVSQKSHLLGARDNSLCGLGYLTHMHQLKDRADKLTGLERRGDILPQGESCTYLTGCSQGITFLDQSPFETNLAEMS